MIKRKTLMFATSSRSLPILLVVVMLLAMMMSGTVPAAIGGGLDEVSPYWPTQPAPFLNAGNITSNSVNLNWSAAQDNVGVTGYIVYMNNQALTTVTGTAYAVCNLSPGANYNFKVEALDEAGNISQNGPAAFAATLPVPSGGGGGGAVGGGGASTTGPTATYAWHSGGAVVDSTTTYVNRNANIPLYDLDINCKASSDTLDAVKVTAQALEGSGFSPTSDLKSLTKDQISAGISFYVYNPDTAKYVALSSKVVSGWVYDSDTGTYSAELEPRLQENMIGSGFTAMSLKMQFHVSDTAVTEHKFSLRVNSIKMAKSDQSIYYIPLNPNAIVRKMEIRSEPHIIWYDIPENKGTINAGVPLSIAFSGPMDAATINTNGFKLLDSSNQPVSANVNYANISPILNYPVHVAWLTPNVPLNGNYTLQVADTVYASNGTGFSSPWLHAFTTGTAPVSNYLQIASRYPLQGASNVELGTAVSILFSNTLDINTVNSANITVTKADGSPINGEYLVTPINENREVRITFPRYLQSKTTYRVTVGTSVKDINGKSLAAPDSWNFSTVSQFLPSSPYRVMIEKAANQWIPGTNLSSIDPSLGVYYYYNGQTIKFKIMPKNPDNNPLNGSVLYANFRSLDPTNQNPIRSANWDAGNQCWTFQYDVPGNLSAVGPCPIMIGTANQQFIAVMMAVLNVNPKNFGLGLGGETTDWSTITDFTDIQNLTFEKYNAQNQKVAKLVLHGSINACELDNDGNPINAFNMQNMGQSLEMAYGKMSINTAIGALAGFNQAATLTLYNIQSNGTPGVRYLPNSGEPIVLIQPGAQNPSDSTGRISAYSWDTVNHTLTLTVNSWSGYEVIPAGTAPSAAHDFISYSLPGQVKSTIDPVNHTITVSMPAGTQLTNLIAGFSLSEGASASIGSVEQISGTTANNFSTPLVYTVQAADNSLQDWTIRVNQEGCFIATAAFGSYLDPHVWVLRQFRDNVLLQFHAGRWFVREYYQHSPALAAVIAQHDSLRMITRILLTPIILAVEYPMLAGMILAGMLLLVLAVKLGTRKRLVHS